MSDKEQKAIQRIKMASEMSMHHYGKPLVCTYSGGKDSDVMLELFRRSGIPYEVHNSHTTADAPQTVRHIRETFRRLELEGIKCDIEMPTYKGERTSMWKLIPQKLMPPTRLVRYCCSVLKETGCKNRFISTGVRWAESTSRKGRGEFEKIGDRKSESEKFSEIMLMNDNDSRRRVTELCMQKAQNGGQSDHRLDEHGCVGVHPIRTHTDMRSVRMRIRACRMHRLPDGREETIFGVCRLSGLQKSVSARL